MSQKAGTAFMNKSITPNQIKQNNKSLIYHYIYQNPKVSQQDIAYDLRLSRPTITTNLNALEADGFIQRDGQITTESAGRKAVAYSIVSDYRIAIGVEVLKQSIKIIAVNLYGQPVDHHTLSISYAAKDSYYKKVCQAIIDFQNMQKLSDSQILGVGFAMQGLISPDGETVVYGQILSCTGLTIDVFRRHLPWPCIFIHDADAAATSELWSSSALTDAFYLSLSTHLGAAMICKRSILSGRHGHNATVEHISLTSDGPRCYCGKRGCLETLCSLSALLEEDESLDDFFQNLREGEPLYKSRFTTYLTNLAKAINLLHLIYDQDFILGGHLAPYLTLEDLAFLHKKIRQMTPFAESEDFLLISNMPQHNIAIGAALSHLQTYLSALFLS